ncbi:MAG: HAMP domain-containing histidine kinase [Pyrinomonadaceae bacterium]|nr:HAMP domain-containing histidine kinase [Pyrinomonadaceae bacterium]
MKRSWSNLILFACLVGVLVMIGGLQYRWLSRISDSDGEKAKKRLNEQAERFAADFNRELQNAYFNFQTEASTWKTSDWTQFNERYDLWRERAAYPELIRDFFFFPSDPMAGPIKYDRESRSFQPAEFTDELRNLRSEFNDDAKFKPVLSDVFSLVLPIHEVSQTSGKILIRTTQPSVAPGIKVPPKFGFLLIRLDPAIVKDKLLPDLVAKYFGDGEFNAAVVDSSGNSVFQQIKGDSIDTEMPLIDLSPGNFLVFADRDLVRSIEGEKRPGLVVSSRIETHSMTKMPESGGDDRSLKIEVNRDSGRRTAVFTATAPAQGTTAGAWKLIVQHSSGSLATYLNSTFRRNMAIGFGLLFLLAAAAAAIIVSARRAKLLAQRQVEFVSSVSHEFRTPLAVISSAGENLADGVTNDTEQVLRYGDLIKRESQKLSAMVEQILEFAGANSGRQRYNFVDISVPNVIDQALNECRPMLDEKGITVRVDVGDALPSVKGDPNSLSGAIQNLIVNAVKYSNGERWIGISAETDGQIVRISVEDKGLGMSKGDLRQAFEPFFRSKQVVDAQIHGNGLGLSLVRKITDSHGGRVSATSELGKGSRFTIELPIG